MKFGKSLMRIYFWSFATGKTPETKRLGPVADLGVLRDALSRKGS
jgi:hypothetical protein